MIFQSPLRYPGGKRKLAPFVADMLVYNKIMDGVYIEPFAGGASVGLYLLFNEFIKQVIINDIDKSIFVFWKTILDFPDEFCKKIYDTPVTVDEWEKQKKVQLGKSQVSEVALAFSTFFLNRTNRSGIIHGGIIGGKQQTGNWKIDARFNKKNLIRRIEKIALYKDRITVYNMDAITMIKKVKKSINEPSLIYFDPPYYTQGASLYTNAFNHEAHKKLAKFILSLDCHWFLTYDYTPEILRMYIKAKKMLLTLNYSAARKTTGHELIAFSDKIQIPQGTYPSINLSILDYQYK